MVEMLLSMTMLVIMVFCLSQVSAAISGLRNRTTDTVYLSIHNLNVMERIRQICNTEYSEPLLYYGDDALGTDEIETTAELERSACGTFNVYQVRVTSRIRDNRTKLVSNFIITDIGGVSFEMEINPE